MKQYILTLLATLLLGTSTYSQTCSSPVATYTPIASEYIISDHSEYASQVFTPTITRSNFNITLELATCKANGLCDAQLDIVTVTGGEPDWGNVIDSAIVPESQIYGWPGCSAGTFGTSTFSFSGITLTSGTQYALVLKPAAGGAPSAGLAWRRSSTPADPSNPYVGGNLWTYNGMSIENSNLDLQFDICATCINPIATYIPIASEYMISDNSEYASQVFTPTISASNFNISLELATCKANGLCDAQLDIVTVTGGEPDWGNVIDSAIVPESQIYGWPGCSAGTFGTSTFSFSGITLTSGTQYALVLKPAAGGAPSAGLAWRRSSNPADPSNPYVGGNLWTYNGMSIENSNLDLQFDLYTNELSQGIDTRTECNAYTWIDGNTYTSSNNTATFNIVGGAANGCDSLVTLNLTINSVSDITTSISGVTISANNTNATYQWLDCDNNNSVISSETNQSFTPTENGNYAVELTENGCVDTTACVTITTVGILENSFDNNLLIYPNPTSGNFSIDLGAIYESSIVSITDISGKLIDSKTITQSQILNLSIKEPAGIYFVSIQAGDKKVVIRLVKE